LRSREAFDIANTSLRPIDFHTPQYKVLWEVLCALSSRETDHNDITIISELAAREQLKKFGGKEALDAIRESPGSPKEVQSYATQLRNFTLAREQKRVGSKLEGLGKTILTPEERISKTRELIAGLESHALRQSRMERLGDVLTRVGGLDEFVTPLQGASLVKSPWPALNELIIGFTPSTINIIGARPSQGKTSLAASIVLDAATNQAKTGAIFSLEMTAQSIFLRCACHIAGVSNYKVRAGTLDAVERERLTFAIAELEMAPLWVSNLAGRTVSEVSATLRKMAAEGNAPDIVMIDYVQLMRPSKHYRDRREAMTEISNELQAMTRDLGTCLLLLSQLRRPDRKDAASRPKAEDLMETGYLEADADTIMLIHRPDFYKKDGDRSKTQLILDKQREGPTGQVRLIAEDKYFRFIEDQTVDID
jgi:replicative DNA helicase